MKAESIPYQLVILTTATITAVTPTEIPTHKTTRFKSLPMVAMWST